MLNSDLFAMLSQYYVTYDVKCCDNFTPSWAEFFDWQISHAYFCFVSAFCFTCKHAETKLKQNNFAETKHCFAFVLFQFCFSFISVITTALSNAWCSYAQWLGYQAVASLFRGYTEHVQVLTFIFRFFVTSYSNSPECHCSGLITGSLVFKNVLREQ